MAATLNIIGELTIEEGPPAYRYAHIAVRKNVLTVARNGQQLLNRGGVVAVEEVDVRTKLIRFDDGSAYLARTPPPSEKKGCGCG